MAYEVKNIRGTAKYKCACGSWYEHYKSNGGSGRACVVCGRKRNLVGGHVLIREKRLMGFFEWKHDGYHIVPLCAECNNPKNTSWVPAPHFEDAVTANTKKAGCHVR